LKGTNDYNRLLINSKMSNLHKIQMIKYLILLKILVEYKFHKEILYKKSFQNYTLN